MLAKRSSKVGRDRHVRFGNVLFVKISDKAPKKPKHVCGGEEKGGLKK
jgi:hypothetical protein